MLSNTIFTVFFAFSPELGYNSYVFFVLFFTLQNLAGFTELLVSFLIAERSASSVL